MKKSEGSQWKRTNEKNQRLLFQNTPSKSPHTTLATKVLKIHIGQADGT